MATILTILYCSCWPFVKAAQAIALAIGLVVSPLWSVARFVLLPITSLLYGIFNITTLPFRLHLVDRIEPLYIYLGIAGLIGCITGALLFFSFNFLSSALRIDPAAEAKARKKGRTTAEYRLARHKKMEASADYSSAPAGLKSSSGARKQRGLLSQTITEEEDSDL